MMDVLVFTEWQAFWMLVAGMGIAWGFFMGWLKRRWPYPIIAFVWLVGMLIGIFAYNPIVGGG